MVLQGQDKWRKHPLLTGNWRKPLPGFGLAVAIFATYLVVEYTSNIAMAPPADAPKTGVWKAGGMGEGPTRTGSEDH